MPERSTMMDRLYGEVISQGVYDRLQWLDPELNEIIQRVAYDFFWTREGLSVRDKSLVTVISLIALNKEEQTKIHMNGFLSAGGTPNDLMHLLLQIAGTLGGGPARNGLAVLREVLKQRQVEWSEGENTELAIDHVASHPEEIAVHGGLSLRDKNLTSVVTAVAIGKISESTQAMVKFLKDGGALEDLRSTMIHQIVYCGFPVAMNGFAALRRAQVQAGS